MATPATASSRTSIERSSRAGVWMARWALSVESTLNGSSSNRVCLILSRDRAAAHQRRDGIHFSAVAGAVRSLPTEP